MTRARDLGADLMRARDLGADLMRAVSPDGELRVVLDEWVTTRSIRNSPGTITASAITAAQIAAGSIITVVAEDPGD